MSAFRSLVIHTDSTDASAVIRRLEFVFEVESSSHAVSRVRQIVTVLSPEGREVPAVSVTHDRYRKLRGITGKIQDAAGQIVRRLQESDVIEFGGVSDPELFQDVRISTAALYHSEYPYTVELSYEIEHDGLMNWPMWSPSRERVWIEFARFELRVPKELPARFVSSNIDGPAISSSNGRNLYVWEIRDLPPRPTEPWSASEDEGVPTVMTAPSVFEIEGREGAMNSWSGFGRWYSSLSAGRDRLPTEVARSMAELGVQIPDPIVRARRVYEYVQERTHYVSVQLGIGRWQPERAESVHRRGYGDCKALTNYTLALMQTAGIEAYPALIRSGVFEPHVVPDFPCNQFNHVILFLPSARDTVWLETTSQTMPFGQIGAANEGRYALVIRPDGSELLRTPTTPAQRNMQVRTGRIVLGPGGDADVEVMEVYTGNKRSQFAGNTGAPRAGWEESLMHLIDLPSFALGTVALHEDGVRRDTLRLTMDLTVKRYATRAGPRLLFRSDMLQRWTEIPPEMKERTQPVEFAFAFTEVDSIEYVLPAGYRLEAAPAPAQVEASFGRYRSVVREGRSGTFSYTRLLQIDQRRIPPERYEEVVSFFRAVVRADGEQVVVTRGS